MSETAPTVADVFKSRALHDAMDARVRSEQQERAKVDELRQALLPRRRSPRVRAAVHQALRFAAWQAEDERQRAADHSAGIAANVV